MSLFGDYLKERGLKDIVENEHGFATFIINGVECYIEDIYVAPEARKGKLASAMADQIARIAKDSGCTVLTGSVVPQAKGATESCKVLLAYGFKVLASKEGLIMFGKEL